jgi:hypothetical protein
MSMGSSQVGATLSPSFEYIFYHYTFPGFPFILILLCECESLTMSQGRIFGELQKLSHVPVDLVRWYATEVGLAGK